MIHPPSTSCSLIHRGTLSSRDAAQITCVRPNRIKTEPLAWGATPGSITTSRRSEAPLPSGRSMKPGRMGPSPPWLQAFKNTPIRKHVKIGDLIPISQSSLCNLFGANTLSCDVMCSFFRLPSSFKGEWSGRRDYPDCPLAHRALPFGSRPHSFALRASQSNCVRTSPESTWKKGMVGPARLSRLPSHPSGSAIRLAPALFRAPRVAVELRSNLAGIYLGKRNGRAGEIRTRGLLVPNEALYQAEPRPD